MNEGKYFCPLCGPVKSSVKDKRTIIKHMMDSTIHDVGEYLMLGLDIWVLY